jgi:hypothetical protein
VLLGVKIFAIVAVATVSGAAAVPAGIFTGVNPIVVFGVAAATAICVTWGLLLGGHRLRSRLVKGDGGDSNAATRARRVADRFGPVGLGLVGPVFPGVVASCLTGVAVGVDSRRLGIWMTVGIALWFALFTVAWWGVRRGLL